MGHFFTARQLKLMGLAAEPPAPGPSSGMPPRCCAKAQGTSCTCDAGGWKCPEHGVRMAPCIPGNTHD